MGHAEFQDSRRVMNRIVVLPFKDADVEDGLRRLIALNSSATVILPALDDQYPRYLKSAMKAITESKAKYHLFFTEATDVVDGLVLNAEDITVCSNPIKELIREITTQDVLAMVWDECMEAHLALHAVEDFAIEVWNIDEGLDMVEVDYDEEGDTDLLYEEMQEKMSEFIEAFAAYLTAGVLDVLTQTLQARIREDEDKRDINPFNEE